MVYKCKCVCFYTRLRIALEKHFGAVNALRAIPESIGCNALKGGEGASFVSGGRDSMINLWTASGDCVGTQAAHRGSVSFLSDLNFNLQYRPATAGAPMMFSLGTDNMVKIWDLKRFKTVVEFSVPLPGTLTKGVWADQFIVTASSNGSVKVWNYTSSSLGGGVCAGEAAVDSSLTSLTRSSDWTSKELSSHSQACTDLISTDTFVASSSKSGHIYRWEK